MLWLESGLELGLGSLVLRGIIPVFLMFNGGYVLVATWENKDHIAIEQPGGKRSLVKNIIAQ